MSGRRILIFDVNWLGDIVLSTPFIRAVKENFPDSYIAVTIPRHYREALEGCPYADEIITFNEHTSHRGVWRKLGFIFELKARKFDMVFLVHRSLTRAMICYLAGIKERIGYYTKKRGWLLTKKITPLPRDKVHRADYYLGILEGAGLKIASRYSEFFLDDSHRLSLADKLREFGLREGERFVVLHAGANEEIRRWPTENFAELARRINNKFGLKAVVSGSVNDIPLGKAIKDLAPKEAVDLSGNTSLKELGALFEKAEMVVSGDTGPMHIASSVGAPVIALFGTASPMITAPRGKGRYVILQKDVGCVIPCRKLDCIDNRCMKAITVDDVMREADNMLTQNPKPKT